MAPWSWKMSWCIGRTRASLQYCVYAEVPACSGKSSPLWVLAAVHLFRGKRFQRLQQGLATVGLFSVVLLQSLYSATMPQNLFGAAMLQRLFAALCGGEPAMQNLVTAACLCCGNGAPKFCSGDAWGVSHWVPQPIAFPVHHWDLRR